MNVPARASRETDKDDAKIVSWTSTLNSAEFLPASPEPPAEQAPAPRRAADVDQRTAAEAHLQLSEWYDECIATGADPLAVCTAMVSAGVNLGLLNQLGPGDTASWAKWLHEVAASVERGAAFPPFHRD